VTDITPQLFTVNCNTHSCTREADAVDGLCSTCRQIRVQVRTRTLTKEADWQRDLIRLAQTLGWKCATFRAAQTKHGWRTPVGADGKGWPDLLLVRDRVIAAEVKNEVGKPTDEQQEWLAWLEAAGVETYVWRPQDLDEVMRVLIDRRREAA
jgi:hypothetical protein